MKSTLDSLYKFEPLLHFGESRSPGMQITVRSNTNSKVLGMIDNTESFPVFSQEAIAVGSKFVGLRTDSRGRSAGVGERAARDDLTFAFVNVKAGPSSYLVKGTRQSSRRVEAVVENHRHVVGVREDRVQGSNSTFNIMNYAVCT